MVVVVGIISDETSRSLMTSTPRRRLAVSGSLCHVIPK